MNVVVSCNSLSRASLTNFSDLASKADVESSKIKIFGLPITPRAIDKRCFWPPEKFDERSSTMCSYVSS